MIRALLGGSFDPVHDGHVAMAEHVLQNRWAQFVHVMPAWLSPHKTQSEATAADRLEMARLAFADISGVVIDTLELDRGQSCYTVDTVANLQQIYPDDQWLLVIGGDNLTSFTQWNRPEELLSRVPVLVLGRQGNDLQEAAAALPGVDRQRLHLVPDFDQRVSSTAVRAMLASGAARQDNSIEQMVDAGICRAVARYIVDHQLYFPDQNGETRVPDPD